MQKTDYSKKSYYSVWMIKSKGQVSGEPGDKLAFLGWEKKIGSSKIC